MIWNTVVAPKKDLLIIEIRNETTRQTAFSAFHYPSQSFLWEDLLLEESWWIGVLGATGKLLLFQTYDEVQNPDHKSLLAINIETRELLWRVSDFSLSKLTESIAEGRIGTPEPHIAVIDLASGNLIDKEFINDLPANEISPSLTPFQYMDGNAYFETIRKFLHHNLNISPVMGIEYLESGGLIIISYYLMEETGLANYLLVMQDDGDVLLTEKLGERLRGLGVDTFFVLSGYLFFVKNKHELLSYRIYD